METLLPILRRIPLFADLNEEEHRAIIGRIVLNYFPVSHVFFHEGEPSNGSMYIIKHGIVRISRKGPTGEETEIAVLNDNDFFGEMALVLEGPRNATAGTVTECEIFELKKDDFLKLMQESPTMANKISREYIERLKKNEHQRTL